MHQTLLSSDMPSKFTKKLFTCVETQIKKILRFIPKISKLLTKNYKFLVLKKMVARRKKKKKDKETKS